MRLGRRESRDFPDESLKDVVFALQLESECWASLLSQNLRAQSLKPPEPAAPAFGLPGLPASYHTGHRSPRLHCLKKPLTALGDPSSMGPDLKVMLACWKPLFRPRCHRAVSSSWKVSEVAWRMVLAWEAEMMRATISKMILTTHREDGHLATTVWSGLQFLSGPVWALQFSSKALSSLYCPVKLFERQSHRCLRLREL